MIYRKRPKSWNLAAFALQQIFCLLSRLVLIQCSLAPDKKICAAALPNSNFLTVSGIQLVTPSPFISFWQKHPALLIGFLFLIGTSFSFHANLIDLLPLAILLIPYLRKPQTWKWIAVFLAIVTLSWSLSAYRCPSISLPSDGIEGEALFKISSIRHHQSPFYRSIGYRGELTYFNGESYSSIPCSIYLPHSSKRPKASCDYRLTGKLEQKGPRQFVFKPQKNCPWTPIPSTYSLAEIRYQAKQTVYGYLKAHITHPETATFLNALATGDVDERTLSMEFNHVGIQHILAISGFHFALVALFLGGVLQLFLHPRLVAVILIVFLSGYYLFLGDSPSIQRAWIASSVFLGGRLFNLRTTPLNALGVALCLELCIDPSVIFSLGFHLSFLCTLAILLFSPLFQRISTYLLPIRSFQIVKAMPHVDQIGYILCSFLRRLITINLAVHIACLPVFLYLFHRFSLLSLIYNLFFPFWVGISLFLLCTALALAWIPPVSHLVHFINTHWTFFALTITEHPPAALDFVLRVSSIPYLAVILFLTALSALAIRFSDKSVSY